MSLIIDPGPLPDDFARVDASAFLETFVNGTRIRNFGSEHFGVDFNFITSSTDEPTQKRGMLWFKRGEGVLKFLDDADRGNSRYTASLFVSLAPRREVLLEMDAVYFSQHTSVPRLPGMILSPRFPPSTTVLNQRNLDVNNRMTVKVSELSANRPMHTAWVATDTPVSGYPIRAVEWGLCTALFGSGVSSVAGKSFRASASATLAFEGSDATVWWHCRHGVWSGETLTQNYGVVMHSSGATEPHFNRVWKRPTCDFYWEE